MTGGWYQWVMLYVIPLLDSADLCVLEQVDALHAQLRDAVQQAPMKWTLDLRKALTASAIAASNTIEGYQVDAKDVADLMDGEREVDASEEDKAETLACRQAMTYIQSLHDVSDFRYGKELLNSLHWMLQGHHHPLRTAGQWRRTSIRITAPGDDFATDYDGPDHELVPDLMAELVDSVSGRSARCMRWRWSAGCGARATSGRKRSTISRRPVTCRP
jgi:Fic family protein